MPSVSFHRFRNCCTEYDRATADPDWFDHRQHLKVDQASLTFGPDAGAIDRRSYYGAYTYVLHKNVQLLSRTLSLAVACFCFYKGE